MMKTKLYKQKTSLQKGIINTHKNFKNFISAFITLLLSFLSINCFAQMISNVALSTTVACYGANASITFTVKNGNGASNYFTTSTNYGIYLSNTSGTGFSLVALFKSSTAPSGDGGVANIIYNLTIPSTIALGSGYKISISSDVPTIAANSGTNVSTAFSVHADPVISYSKQFTSTCDGGSDGAITLNVTGGAPPYNYSWTGVGGFTATTQNITNLALGDYNVVVTDQDQCSTTDQGLTIKTGTPPSVGLWSKSDAGCNGNDGVINSYMIGGYNGGATPTQYQLSGSMSRPYQNSGVFSGLIPGNYTITVKDSKGCTASNSTPIVISQSPSLSFTSNSRNVNVSACGNGKDGSSYVEISGGVAPYQYILNGVVQQTTAATTYTFTSLQPNISYSLTITDSKGCSLSKNITLSKDPTPIAQVAYKGNVSCNGGDDGFISLATSYSGIGIFMYSIDGGMSYQSKNVFYNLTAGTYNVVVKDANACASIPLPVVITQVSPIVLKSNSSSTSVSACGGGIDGTITPVVTGGAPPYHYSINGVEKQITSAQYYVFTGLSANVAYNISITDSKGCNTVSEVVTLNQVSAPVPIIAYMGNETCIGANNGFISVATTLGGVPYYTFSSDNGMTYQAKNVFYNLSPGTYNVVVKDSKGCVSAPVDVVINAGTASCVDGRIAGNVVDASGSRINTQDEKINSKLLDSPLDLQGYPNPFATEFTLNVQGNNTDKISIIVTDVLGRRWYQSEGSANQQYRLGNNLKSGVYIVQVIQANKIQTIEIVKE